MTRFISDDADGEWDDCNGCDGTGRDSSEWDGRCVFCGGQGDRFVRHTGRPEDELEDDEAQT